MVDASSPDRRKYAFSFRRLAELRRHGDDACARAARAAAELCANALSVERVGLWVFTDNRTVLHCQEQYVRSRGQHCAGESLRASEFPSYIAAASEHRVIAVADALDHPFTRELRGYLERHGIVSMLDAPVVLEGAVIGVLCHEHVGAPREWTQADEDFAARAAELIGLVYGLVHRLLVEGSLDIESERRRHTSKMDAVARVAQSVLHDFNNLLMVAGSAVSDLGEHSDPAVRDQATRIERALGLARDVARTLGTVGGEPRQASSVVDLAQLLRVARDRLAVLLTGNRSLSVQVPEAPVWIHGDAAEIERAVLNLLHNAAAATDDDGRIEITLVTPLGEDFCELRVGDDGAGMDPETLERAFEPYFTARPEGTGLGLANVYGTVRSLGGEAEIESFPGEGTVVILRFLLAPPPR